ncbi:MAG: response regulator [Roseateles depolymerans]|uniref:Response regulator n=1 Tax=Roseateles depolymerans TaxID=76731 RepID=A0A2W5DFJ8_9BURK|nr:MAG: response regulator [Roseateles depolymerans]
MPSSARALVLYIEDDRIQLILAEEMFRRLPDWELLCAETGAEALELLARQRPLLALIDMRLPDTTGLELVARLRRDPALAGLRCVAVSADDPAELRAAAREAGFDDYWAKPLDVARLKPLLDSLIQ